MVCASTRPGNTVSFDNLLPSRGWYCEVGATSLDLFALDEDYLVRWSQCPFLDRSAGGLIAVIGVAALCLHWHDEYQDQNNQKITLRLCMLSSFSPVIVSLR